MVNVDLDSILLSDSEFYDPDAVYISILEKKNITTVGQLLDICSGRSNFKLFARGTGVEVNLQLYGFVTMLENQYLRKPLPIEHLFEKKIDFERSSGKHGIIYFSPIDENLRGLSLNGFLGYRREFLKPIFKEFLAVSENYKNELRLIDFLNWIAETSKDVSRDDLSIIEKIMPFVNVYIALYKKKTLEASKNQLSQVCDGYVESTLPKGKGHKTK